MLLSEIHHHEKNPLLDDGLIAQLVGPFVYDYALALPEHYVLERVNVKQHMPTKGLDVTLYFEPSAGSFFLAPKAKANAIEKQYDFYKAWQYEKQQVGTYRRAIVMVYTHDIDCTKMQLAMGFKKAFGDSYNIVHFFQEG